ncbi:sulfite exporter TauE/SafE family protein [Methylocystis sp. SC2]|uniref:sulfite exporter TauE/SafE family protein n=1 Tax=Methylocystis sp. (strain SC2) TaxID=187303 RepID=UPI00027AEEE0|nr:sulfite exporter TauE/SafE family protein [Methylocystis sp. SC2]CCJ05815.1 Conserved hypothetical membrane protein [Methylocystis sp. SC2]
MPALSDALGAINLLYSASGFFVGALVGFTGVGGGSLMTPILMLVFGVPPTTAVGTDLLYAAVTKTNGTLVHALHGTVDWRITRRLAYGSVPASIASLLVLSWLGKTGGDAANGLITSALGFALLLTAFSILFRRWILDHISRHTNDMSDRRLLWLTAILGVLLGVLVSISSVGAGAIGMTVLLALYSHTPTARLIGSDIAHAVPLTLIAGFGHWLMGGVDWLLLLSLLIGSLPGIAIGAHFATRVPDRYLRPALASVMALVGIKLSI